MDYKPTLTIHEKDYPGISLLIGDTGSITLNFEVVGINKAGGNSPLMDGEEAGDISYTLEYSTDKLTKDKMSLQKATEKATKDLYVKTQTQPAP